jgi:HsdM-like protein
MPDHNYFANLIWQIADLLRGPYRPPQYERVMLPMTVLRRFDCVLAPTKAKVLAEHARRKGGKLEGDALDTNLNTAAGQRFHHHSPLDFEKLKGDPDNIEKHLVSYIKGFSKNVRDIFEFFEFENEIDRMRVRKWRFAAMRGRSRVRLRIQLTRVVGLRCGYFRVKWSGRLDSNQRPPAPKAGAGVKQRGYGAPTSVAGSAPRFGLNFCGRPTCTSAV